MKAIIIEKFGKTSQVKVAQMPVPHPSDHEVQIAIEYTSVNPVDWKILEGHLESYPHEFPLVLGWDAAGRISKVGKNVREFKVGDEVFCYCRKPFLKWGTYAEYICVDVTHVALKPKNISFAEAASIPLVALTAWQSLFDEGKLQRNEKVLIHAGSGGVGSMAIQLAKSAGAYVITTTSKKNSEYVKSLGADFVIDYTKERFTERINEKFPQGIDLAFDTIGGEICYENFEILKHNGRLVSILEQFGMDKKPPKGISCHYVFVEPNGKELKQIAQLIEKGKVAPPKIEVMKLEDAAQALEKSKTGHVAGKIVLNIHAA
jgi:NADPH2:quinone reductase